MLYANWIKRWTPSCQRTRDESRQRRFRKGDVKSRHRTTISPVRPWLETKLTDRVSRSSDHMVTSLHSPHELMQYEVNNHCCCSPINEGFCVLVMSNTVTLDRCVSLWGGACVDYVSNMCHGHVIWEHNCVTRNNWQDNYTHKSPKCTITHQNIYMAKNTHCHVGVIHHTM